MQSSVNTLREPGIAVFLVHRNPQLKSWIGESMKGSRYRITDETASGKSAAEMVKSGKVIPDIVMVDITVEIMNIYDTVTALRNANENVKLMILAKYEEIYSLVRSFIAGSAAFLTYDVPRDKFMQVIEEVHRNGRYFSELQWQRLMPLVFQQQYHPPLFTKKQLDTLALVCRNYDYKQMSTALKIPEGAAASRVISMLRKTGFNRKADLAAFAVRTGLVTPDAYEANFTNHNQNLYGT